jgi:hypothetical protein
VETESNPQPPPPTPPTLEYAKRPALAWVSRHRRLLIFVALCLAIGGPIWWYWAPLKHRVLWLYWFHQAAQYQMPAKAVDVFIDDPAKVKLASSNPDFITPANRGSTLSFCPVVYRRLLQYDSRLNLTGGNDRPVAFMGTLHRPDGMPRLVIVSGYSGITSNLLGLTSVLVLPPPRWSDPLPPASTNRIGRGMGGSGPPPTETRLRSGVIDPTDSSHISFEFEAGPRGGFLRTRGGTTAPVWTISATGIIDAHLQNDDSIAFTLRSFTGTDPNIRVGSANGRMIGDVQALQAQSQQRAGQAAAARSTTRPTTPPAGRSRGR